MRRIARAGLLASLLAAGPVAAEPVVVVLQPQGGIDPAAILLAIPKGGVRSSGTMERAPDQKIHVQVKPGMRRIELDLAAGTVWSLTLAGPGLYAPDRNLLVGAAQNRVVVPVWPTTTISGRLPASVPPEASLTVFAAPVPGSEEPLSALDLPCWRHHREYSCEVPATRLDLRFRVEGFSSDYRWGLALSAGREQPLGELALVAGSSLVGTVHLPEGVATEKTPKIRLRPLGQPAAATLSVEPRAPRGLFQFIAVPPGSYVLEVEHPRWVAAPVPDVAVRAGRETELRTPLRLGPPLALSVALQPPGAPDGAPWSLELRRISETGGREEEVARAEISTGRWSRRGLAPASYRVRLTGSEGSVWHNEEIVLTADSHLVIELAVVEVEGELLLAGEPLAAEVWFGGRSGPRRHRFESDRRGRFAGFLPRLGDWRVEVHGERVRRIVPSVRVESSESAGGRVRIELPGNTVRGRVVDPDGRPVAPAYVHAYVAEEGLVSVRNRDDGRFEIAGVAGKLRLQAEAADGSASEDWVVADAESEEPVEIVVRPRHRVRGWLRDEQGRGLVGATISATPADNPLAFSVNAVSGADGRFFLDLPPGTRRASFRILAPGLALDTATRDLVGEVELVLSRRVGRLHLVAARPLSAGDPGEASAMLLRDGVHLGMPQLLQWARLQGGRPGVGDHELSVDGVAAGFYSACWLSNADLARLPRGEPPGSPCSAGYLPEGGELVLSMPEPPAAGSD